MRRDGSCDDAFRHGDFERHTGGNQDDADRREKTETINAEVGSLARGYETPECQGDGKTYVCVEEEDGGFGWKQVTDCTDDELNTAIHAHLPKANYGDMTREDKISLIEALTEDKEQD